MEADKQRSVRREEDECGDDGDVGTYVSRIGIGGYSR